MKHVCKIDVENVCDSVYNGIEALEAVKKDVETLGDLKHSRYKLIIMDCNMPFRDGYEATQDIRKFLY